jgi:hypothetical protein
MHTFIHLEEKKLVKELRGVWQGLPQTFVGNGQQAESNRYL